MLLVLVNHGQWSGTQALYTIALISTLRLCLGAWEFRMIQGSYGNKSEFVYCHEGHMVPIANGCIQTPPKDV